MGIGLGSVSITPGRIWQIITAAAPPELGDEIIVWYSRIPRVLTAVASGAALAVSGALMQTLFRNPLAGPSVLGVTSGSSLAVAVALMAGPALFVSKVSLVLAAVVGAMAVLVVIILLARRVLDITTVLIVGLMISFFTSAGVSILQLFSSDTSLRQFVFWGFGSFSTTSLPESLCYLLVLLPLTGLSFLLVKPLNALLLGEAYAVSLGVSMQKTRFLILLSTGLLTGLVTAFCGPVAFIGIAAPHLVRLTLNTANHRVVLPLTALAGSVLALACDVISRLPGTDFALPLNAVSCMFGAPVVIYLVFRRRAKRAIV